MLFTKLAANKPIINKTSLSTLSPIAGQSWLSVSITKATLGFAYETSIVVEKQINASKG